MADVVSSDDEEPLAADEDSMAQQVATQAPVPFGSFRSIGSIPSMASTLDLQAVTQAIEDVDEEEPLAESEEAAGHVTPGVAALQADIERLSNCLWGVTIHQETVHTLDDMCRQHDVQEILDEPEIVEVDAAGSWIPSPSAPAPDDYAGNGTRSPPTPAHPPSLAAIHVETAELQAPLMLPKKISETPKHTEIASEACEEREDEARSSELQAPLMLPKKFLKHPNLAIYPSILRLLPRHVRKQKMTRRTSMAVRKRTVAVGLHSLASRD